VLPTAFLNPGKEDDRRGNPTPYLDPGEFFVKPIFASGGQEPFREKVPGLPKAFNKKKMGSGESAD